jgi:hypothetical protein
MTESLSYQHAVNTIKLLYEKTGYQLPKKTNGQNVYNEFNIDIKDSKMSSLFAFVDEYISILRTISQFYILAAAEKNSYSGTYYKLINRQIESLTSIRLLCSYSLDNNARQTLRLLHETALVWTRCLIDETFFIEYSKSFGLKESNEFWHKFIKSNKTEKYIQEFTKNNNLSWIGNLNEQIGHMKTITNATSHPNFTVDSLTFQSSFLKDTFGDGNSLDSSHATLTYAIMCIAMPFSIIPIQKDWFSLSKNFDVKIPEENVNVKFSMEYYENLKKMIGLIFQMSTKFSNKLNV